MSRSSHSLVKIILLLAAATFGSTMSAQPSAAEFVSVKVSASVETVHAGESFLLAFQFQIEPHWHIYWRNPGDTGIATSIEIDAPEGWIVGDMRWSRPQTFPGTFVSYGYEDAATLFVPITASAHLAAGVANFKAVIDWLVCKDSCLIGSDEKTITVQTNTEPVVAIQKHAFEDPNLLRAFRQLPREALAGHGGIEITRRADTFVITGPARGFAVAEFLPNHTPGVSTTVADLTVSHETDSFRLTLVAEMNRDKTLGISPVAGGVILLGSKRTDPSYKIALPLEGKADVTSPATPKIAGGH